MPPTQPNARQADAARSPWRLHRLLGLTMPLSENPVYRREGLERWWRMTSANLGGGFGALISRARVAATAGYFLFLMVTYLILLEKVVYPDPYGTGGGESWPFGSPWVGSFWIAGFIFALLAALLTAPSIAGERSRLTWDQLLLTRLRPRDILFAKLLGRLAPLAIVAATIAPAGLIVIRLSLSDLPAGERWYAAMFSLGPVHLAPIGWLAPGGPPVHLAGPFWIYLSGLLWIMSGGCFGLFCSLRLRSSASAVATSVVCLAFIFAGNLGAIWAARQQEWTAPLKLLCLFAWPLGGSVGLLWLAIGCFHRFERAARR
jgi:hypothetical protein